MNDSSEWKKTGSVTRHVLDWSELLFKKERVLKIWLNGKLLHLSIPVFKLSKDNDNNYINVDVR